jgi:hypothetical protein
MWVMSWIDRNFDEIRRGPALTQSARFGGLLVIMLCGLIAGLWGPPQKSGLTSREGL